MNKILKYMDRHMGKGFSYVVLMESMLKLSFMGLKVLKRKTTLSHVRFANCCCCFLAQVKPSQGSLQCLRRD